MDDLENEIRKKTTTKRRKTIDQSTTLHLDEILPDHCQDISPNAETTSPRDGIPPDLPARICLCVFAINQGIPIRIDRDLQKRMKDVNQSIKQSINQSKNQSINQSTNQVKDWISINGRQVNQSIKQEFDCKFGNCRIQFDSFQLSSTEYQMTTESYNSKNSAYRFLIFASPNIQKHLDKQPNCP